MSPNVEGLNNNNNYQQYFPQTGNIVNNNYYYNIPADYYQDRLNLSSQSGQVSFQGMAQNYVNQGGCYAQTLIGGQSYAGMTPSDQLQLLFLQTSAMMNAMLYGQGSMGNPMGGFYGQNDPLADVRGLQALTNQTIANAFAPIQGDQAFQGNQAQGTEQANQATATEKGGISAAKAAKIEKAADIIFEAIDGLGTDEATIFQILEGFSPEDRAYLEIAYANKHGNGNPEALREDLKGDLSGSNERKALDLLNEGAHKTPIAASIALHNAINGVGTDEKTVKTIFENASPEEIAEVEKTYDEMYGDGKTAQLRKDIKGDYSQFWDGLGAGAAKGYGAGTVLGMIPGLNFITGSMGATIGGILGLASDPSGKERNAYIGKLNQAILAPTEETKENTEIAAVAAE